MEYYNIGRVKAMSENQKQMLIDVTNIITTLNIEEATAITKYAEKLIDIKLLSLEPTILLENMDTTEKVMLLKELSKSDEQRQKEENEAISIEDFIVGMGLTNEIHN